MPITTLAVDDPLTAAKVNEIIDALNAIAVSTINFDGTGAVSIRSMSGNISGVTRLLPGAYRISFLTSMSDDDYVVAGMCSPNVGNDTGFVQLQNQSVNSFDIYCRNDDGGANDCSIVTITVFGS